MRFVAFLNRVVVIVRCGTMMVLFMVVIDIRMQVQGQRVDTEREDAESEHGTRTAAHELECMSRRARASTALCLSQVPDERGQCLTADVVLDAFGIGLCNR